MKKKFSITCLSLFAASQNYLLNSSGKNIEVTFHITEDIKLIERLTINDLHVLNSPIKTSRLKN